MKRIFGIWTFLFMVLFFNGCVARSIFSSDALKNINSYADVKKEIHIGMSMDEVKTKWGEPAKRSTINSKTTWIYYELKSSKQDVKGILVQAITGGGSMDRKIVSISFNEQNIIENMNYSEYTR